MSDRVIVVDDVRYTYRVTSGGVVARGPDRKSIKADLSDVNGLSPSVVERGQWKRTSDASVTPKHVATWLRQEAAKAKTAAEPMKTYEQIAGPTRDWEGNCFGIASKLAKHFGGIAVYGHWLGKISPKATFWAKKREMGFSQHGWIVLPNAQGRYGVNCETIVDPTRWSFEAKKPYIWRGKNDGTYDEGGNQVRMSMRAVTCPDGPPEDDGTREPIEISLSCDEIYQHIKRRVLGYSDFHDFSEEYPFLCRTDAVWVANTDPAVIGWFYVAEVYEALARAGMHAHIPTDNWKMVDRRFRLKDADDLNKQET